MTIKKDLKDIGKYLITPLPAKYHFEGVDNRRAARNLLIGSLAVQAIALTAFVAGPVIMETAMNLKDKVKNCFKK